MVAIKQGLLAVLRRPILTVTFGLMLGVFIACAVAMALLSVQVGSRIEQMDRPVSPTIEILPTDGLEAQDALPERELQEAAALDGVADVQERAEAAYEGDELAPAMPMFGGGASPFGEGEMPFGEGGMPFGEGGITEMMRITVNGVGGDASGILLAGGELETVSGRPLEASDSGEDVAMISASLAESNGLDVGSELDLEGEAFEVVGLYDTAGPSEAAGPVAGSGSSMVLPLETMQRLYDVDGVNSATVEVADGASIERVADDVRGVMGAEAEVTSEAEQLAAMLQPLESARSIMNTALFVALAFALGVAVLAAFVMLRRVKGEIQVLRATGTPREHAIARLVAELVALAAVSVVSATLLFAVAGPAVAGAFAFTGGPGGAGSPPLGMDPSVAPDGGSQPPMPGGGMEGGMPGAPGGASPISLGLTPEIFLLLVVGVLSTVGVASIVPAVYVARLRPAAIPGPGRTPDSRLATSETARRSRRRSP